MAGCLVPHLKLPAQGATFVNQYIVVKTLGRGAYGKVKLCLDSQDHELYAIKIINNARSMRKGRALAKNRCVHPPHQGCCGAAPARTDARVGLRQRIRHPMWSGSAQAAQADWAWECSATQLSRSPQRQPPCRSGEKPIHHTLGSLDSSVVQEIAVMKTLDHPNIVRLVEVIGAPPALRALAAGAGLQPARMRGQPCSCCSPACLPLQRAGQS